MRAGELRITAYIKSGHWKYVLCASYHEAADFQWFAIERLNPLTNRRRDGWNPSALSRYEFLLANLATSPFVDLTHGLESRPGVYVLYHDRP